MFRSSPSTGRPTARLANWTGRGRVEADVRKKPLTVRAFCRSPAAGSPGVCVSSSRQPARRRGARESAEGGGGRAADGEDQAEAQISCGFFSSATIITIKLINGQSASHRPVQLSARAGSPLSSVLAGRSGARCTRRAADRAPELGEEWRVEKAIRPLAERKSQFNFPVNHSRPVGRKKGSLSRLAGRLALTDALPVDVPKSGVKG